MIAATDSGTAASTEADSGPERAGLLAAASVTMFLIIVAAVSHFTATPMQERNTAWVGRSPAVAADLQSVYAHDFEVTRGWRAGAWHEAVTVDGRAVDCQVRTDHPLELSCTGVHLDRR